MKTPLTTDIPFASGGPMRDPNAAEMLNGFPCGPADRELFNALMYRLTMLEAEVGRVVSASNITFDENNLQQLAKAVRSQAMNYAVASGDPDALVVSLNPALDAYTAGLPLRVKTDSKATGATTIDVDDLGAVPITYPDGTAIDADAWEANVILDLICTGQSFVLVGLTTAPASGGGNGGGNGGGSVILQYVPGTIILTFEDTPPAGTYELDGSAVSRAANPVLFSKYGTKYGSGDGSTTFNLPDVRGEFLRCWDHGAGRDPDAATRTARPDGQGGDKVGTKQGDQYKAHSHSASGNNPNGLVEFPHGGGANVTKVHTGSEGWSIQSGGSITVTVNASGGTETRPRNINVLACVAGG